MRFQQNIFVMVILLFTGRSSVGYAQQYYVNNYGIDKGLSSSSVNQIFQDSKGYLWFATQGGGVNKFNGKTFRNYKTEDGLLCNDVTCIAEDSKGCLWFGTTEGVSVFDGTKFLNYTSANGLGDGVVYSLYSDKKDDKIWIALQEGGIQYYNKGKFENIAPLSSKEAYAITCDKTGNFWFGVSNGISKYSNGKITNYATHPLVGEKVYFATLTDTKNNVWFGATSGNVVVFRPNGAIEKLLLPVAVSNDFIGCITEDKRGNIWFATEHGVLKYDSQHFTLFNELNGITSNSVQTVLSDNENNIWVGTLSGGADQFTSEAFLRFSDKEGLNASNINSILKDTQYGDYLVSTTNGLFLFNPALSPSFRPITYVKGIEKSIISSVYKDKKGLFWVCTQNGIFVIARNGEHFSLQKVFNEVHGQQIISPLACLEDTQNNLWVATYGSGILRIKDNTISAYSKENGFQSNNILCVYKDTQSRMWFGTQDAGAYRWESNTFKAVATKAKAIWSITEDNNGIICLGTGKNGICFIDGKHVHYITQKEGLHSNYIPALQFNTKQHCFWIGSEYGLEKLELNKDYTVNKVTKYTSHNGFPLLSINQNGMLNDEKNGLWLCTIKGLWHYNGDLDFDKLTSARIILEEVKLNFQSQDWKARGDSIDPFTQLPSHLELSYSENQLTFKVQGLTTDELSYSFLLEGQDYRWSQPSLNNEITYSNIAPGEYVFVARAYKNNAVNSKKTVQFSFTIHPPWWKTWWFYGLIVLGLIFGITGFIKFRESALKQQNAILEQSVKNRTAELSAQKKLVEETLEEKEKLLSEKDVLLKEIHHRVKNNLQTISSLLQLQSAGLKDEQAKMAINESQHRVRSIALVHQKLYQNDGLETIELSAFTHDLSRQTLAVYNEKATSVTINVSIPETFLLIDKAIPIGLILNELLTNSFKYAFPSLKAGVIDITLHTLSSSLEEGKTIKQAQLVYRDNGPGFQLSGGINNSTTLGLRLVRLLSKQIGATLEYTNEDGSEFNLIFSVTI